MFAKHLTGRYVPSQWITGELISKKNEVLHIEPLPLDVREVEREELDELFDGLSKKATLLDLIDGKDATDFSDPDFDDEYGGDNGDVSATGNTWTVAVMTDLKAKGKSLSRGWIKRLLRTALPLGGSISIKLDETVLSSAKSETPVWREWVIGSDFLPDEIVLDDGESIKIEKGLTEYPSLQIEGIGEITGAIRLYSERISGGKI